MHYITLSFDDGFKKSSIKTAALFEKFGLKAEFNVVATFHQRDPVKHGDFGLWNELQARGHFIQPHGYNHTNKTKVPLAEAQDLIRRCLDVFQRELKGFDAHQTIFAFPYNDSNAEIEAWLAGEVRAFRSGHGSAVNPLPGRDTMRLTTAGGEDAESTLEDCLAELFSREQGWLVYTAHGLDGEGWGPLRSSYLEATLERLVVMPGMCLLPAQVILATLAQAGG
jgi:peptidoglycan/xylan/chitin deacetylase (PgdA/CDA1 family)